MYKDQYLRFPTAQDTKQLLKLAEGRGFPGMMGLLYCMHWSWKNCPNAYKGIYRGKEKEPTIILEAVMLYELWIWHALFSLPGALNNINILQQSPVFDKIQEGKVPEVNFTVNGTQYGMAYYPANGIYPSWVSALETTMLPKRLQQCSLLILLFNTSISIL
jgi:hypothetical protein